MSKFLFLTDENGKCRRINFDLVIWYGLPSYDTGGLTYIQVADSWFYVIEPPEVIDHLLSISNPLIAKGAPNDPPIELTPTCDVYLVPDILKGLE